MAEITLVAEAGRPHGSPASRRLRRQGKVPAVLYGHGMVPIALAVEARELRNALSTEAGSNALLRVEVGSKHHLALAREIQRHPLRHTITHVDFQVVRRDEVMSAEVPVVLAGEAGAVHRGGGTVEQEMFALPVRAKPGDLPAAIEVSIEDLEIGQAIRVRDLELPKGVALDTDEEALVVAAHAPRAVAVAEEEAAPPAEGEAAEAGAGPAAASADESSQQPAAES
jgi:large subunit ribosomal protein L25